LVLVEKIHFEILQSKEGIMCKIRHRLTKTGRISSNLEKVLSGTSFDE
jgi:hypothetical protein